MYVVGLYGLRLPSEDQAKNNEEDEEADEHGAKDENGWIFPRQEVAPELRLTRVHCSERDTWTFEII